MSKRKRPASTIPLGTGNAGKRHAPTADSAVLAALRVGFDELGVAQGGGSLDLQGTTTDNCWLLQVVPATVCPVSGAFPSSTSTRKHTTHVRRVGPEKDFLELRCMAGHDPPLAYGLWLPMDPHAGQWSLPSSVSVRRVVQHQDRVQTLNGWSSWPPACRVLVVDAGMGTGKTYRAQELIGTLPTSSSVMVIAARCSLVSQWQSSLSQLGFTHYQDLSLWSASEHEVNVRRIVVTPQSLYRTQIPSTDSASERWLCSLKYDLVVVDEWSVLVDSFSSQNTHREAWFANLRCLQALLSTAQHVLVLDADWMCSAMNWRLLRYAATDRQVAVDHYERRPRQRELRVAFRDFPSFVEHMVDGHRKGVRNFVACATTQEAETLHSALNDSDELTIQDKMFCNGQSRPAQARASCALYDSHVGQDVLEDLRDVDTAWVRYANVVGTTSIGAGTSFNVPDHFAVALSLRRVPRGAPLRDLVQLCCSTMK